MVLVVISLFLVSCQQTNVTDSDSTKQKESNSIIEKVTDTFSSDAIKLKKEFFKLNDENLTFFTDATILKEGSDIKIDFVVTPNVTSKMLLDVLALGISTKTYEITPNFENIKITYLNEKKQQLGLITIPKKAIKDITDYTNQNNNDAENPYTDAFWKVSQRMYDQSVPELIPESITKEIFGDIPNSNTNNIASALSKKVTHLKIECYGPNNWDSDADDDGINYYISPLSEDGTIVPIEGTYETKAYDKVPKDDWGYQFEKGQQLYTQKGSLEGQGRLSDFDEWYGYKIKLNWDDVSSYMASSSDFGIMYVTFTDKQGASYEAKTGEDSYGGCQLRAS